MNERIQELAYEAEEQADREVDQGSEFHLAFCRIFAELIVWECCGVVNDGSRLGGWYDMRIKEHFGVEE
jgi:hypothetical protein